MLFRCRPWAVALGCVACTTNSSGHLEAPPGGDVTRQAARFADGPEEKRLNTLDFYEHDLRIVVLDRQGRVRGYYSVFHPQPEITETMTKKLARDVERLLENPAD